MVVACLLLAVLALVLAGCGASGAEEGTLSKREYIERFNTQQRDAARIFGELGTATRDPKAAQTHLDDFDALIKGLKALDPPIVWKSEHARMITALQQMRDSMAVIARAPASRTAIITTQVRLYTAAQDDFQAAVRAVNETR
jgi:CHASE3 domain sensor protein